jgi:hypothetical protein
MKRQFFLICIFLLVSSIQLLSQSTRVVTGKIINADTLGPMPFANIVLKENNLGVISNADGDFKIPCNPNFQHDSLTVSFIGFKQSSIPFANLSENKVNKIYLAPVSLELTEVVIVADRKR